MSSPTPRILASLRSADRTDLDGEVRSLTEAGIDGLHVDVMDGSFVDESCFDPDFVAGLRPRTRLMIDVHLLAEDPASLVEDYARAGADRIAFHLETTDTPGSLIEAIRAAGAEPGLVLLPSTPVEDAFGLLADLVLINPLGVDPKRGLGFQETTFERIERIAAERERRGVACTVQADGGIWEKTRDGLVAAGADELVGGYPIFSREDYAAGIRALRIGN